MRPITPAFLDELIDFAATDADRRKAFVCQQREGTVAVFNMLARNGCAYLADEVGMGKTYIALGVMSLLRYHDPHARIVVIAPRANIQHKWVKELGNFVRHNWRVVGNRVKSPQGEPVWEPVVCHSLVEFARQALANQDRDFFLRMSSFSIPLKDPERRERRRDDLLRNVPWLERRHVPTDTPEGFRDNFAVALNGAVPDADLVVVDESHNLKHGFLADGSTRNRVMGLAFGHAGGHAFGKPWYTKKAKRVLLLSATPFEDDYASIRRQLDVLGFGDALLRGANGEPGSRVEDLLDPDVPEDEKRGIVKRLLIRRVSGLDIGGRLHTKNMYRREWRRGGLESHDKPIRIEDPRQRLTVALMQKKVAEVLQTERFNNRFQIGMLSSFESFLQSAVTEFDGEEQHRGLTDRERDGIDTQAVASVASSYRERFGEALPHPKLDATAAALSDAFETGEKTLVFVRRVATVGELAAKLEESFDVWIRKRMKEGLPALHGEIDELFARYRRERLQRPDEIEAAGADYADSLGANEPVDRRDDVEAEDDDEVRPESFFAWFFRGSGPDGVLSGTAFRKNRLSSTSSVYASLFEDDYVASLLGVEAQEVIESLARRRGEPRKRVTEQLRRRAFGFFRERSRQRDGYPRLYVIEAYQAAGLAMLGECSGSIGTQARDILEERFPETSGVESDPPAGFPAPDAGLGLTTVFTELRRRPALRDRLWPREERENFREEFRRREQRRELLSAMARLGAAYIDLYMLAVRRIGSFTLDRGKTDSASAAKELATEFTDLLEHQLARRERNDQPRFDAGWELAQAAGAFDHILAANFPAMPSRKLPELARLYAETLQKQVPVGRMAGSVNQRLVRQFRMPGFPLVLVTTDVLQEGEDLHTFCRRVVHYGIAWTAAAMEQRTGRVDRIGGLVQRNLDGAANPAAAEELIQVYYPHLPDTVEVLQVRRVLCRLNRFMRLVHRGNLTVGARGHAAIDTSRALLEEEGIVASIEGQLESAFPIEQGWLRGELGAGAVAKPDWEPRYQRLEELWREVRRHYAIEERSSRHRHLRQGTLTGDGRTDFTLELRSHVAGDEILLRCESEVGLVDLEDDIVVDALLDSVARVERPGARAVKLCFDPGDERHGSRVYVRRDILFDPDATRLADVRAMLEDTLFPAVRLHAALDKNRLLGSSGD